MTGLVALLYVLGWALTSGAALWAYVQAKRTRDDIGGRMDRIAAAEREHSEVTQAEQERWEEYVRAGAGLEGRSAMRAAGHDAGVGDGLRPGPALLPPRAPLRQAVTARLGSPDAPESPGTVRGGRGGTAPGPLSAHGT